MLKAIAVKLLIFFLLHSDLMRASENMVSTTNSMPIVIVFERHWDPVPKKILKLLIKKLSAEGYKKLCFEAPHDLNSRQWLSWCKDNVAQDRVLYSEVAQRLNLDSNQLNDLGFSKLTLLMQLFVSSNKCLDVAERIKGFLASELLVNSFDCALSHSFEIKGIDINSEEFAKIVAPDIAHRMPLIRQKEKKRIATISENLLRLYREDNGLIFVCGALHAENLIRKFTERQMQDSIIYCFPHADKKYDDSLDDVKELLSNDTLKDHAFCIRDENDAFALVEKIVKEVKSKNTQYRKEIIDENSHGQFLNKVFQVKFRLFMRHGHYMDALLNMQAEECGESIFNTLKQKGISIYKKSFNKNVMLVIPEINTEHVARKIRLLK
jgi:hypothetical protein